MAASSFSIDDLFVVLRSLLLSCTLLALYALFLAGKAGPCTSMLELSSLHMWWNEAQNCGTFLGPYIWPALSRYVCLILSAHLISWVASVFGERKMVLGGRDLDTTSAADDSNRQDTACASGLIEDRYFYEHYHGHKIGDLKLIHKTLKEKGCNNFVFFCGDSSLDNKHWFFKKVRNKKRRQGTIGSIETHEMLDDQLTGAACNGYEHVLTADQRGRPRMAKDVCYWFNRQCADCHGPLQLCTIMSSLEASTAADRYGSYGARFGLTKHDQFIRDYVTENDYIVMSVAGNDVALAPTIATAVNMALLVFSPHWLIWLGLAPGYPQLTSWLYKMLSSYVNDLTAKTMPRKLVVNMIYYPDETPSGGWADDTLNLLLYRKLPFGYPRLLQFAIRSLFLGLRARIKSRAPTDLPGLDIELFPLFETLDGKDTRDYVQRVEPSVQGGEKMAKALLNALGFQAPVRIQKNKQQ